MTERSAGNDTNVSSASTDDAVGQPKRYAHGSEIGEALRARVIAAQDEAIKEYRETVNLTDKRYAYEHLATYWAFRAVERWIDAIKADAATDNDKAGSRCS